MIDINNTTNEVTLKTINGEISVEMVEDGDEYNVYTKENGSKAGKIDVDSRSRAKAEFSETLWKLTARRNYDEDEYKINCDDDDVREIAEKKLL